MALSRMVKRKMKHKKLAALAFAATLAATTIPTFAATGTVTVKWNTQAIATLTLTTQASAATTHAASENIYWAGNGSTASGCNGTTNTAAAGTDTSAAGTINFGNVTPDSVNYTNCLEVNAVNANLATNDTNGYNVTVQATAGAPANFNAAAGTELCLLPNGTWANNLAYTASARAAAVAITSTTACPGGDFQVGSASATTLLATTASTAGTNLPADMELVLGPNVPTGAQSVTVTYTLTTL